MLRIKKYASILLASVLSALIILSCGCSDISSFGKLSVSSVKTNHGSSSFRIYDKASSEKVLTGDGCSLYFDRKSGGIALFDNDSTAVFSSLPDFSNSFAAAFIVCVSDGNDIHYLDTSIHSAENKGIEFSEKDGTFNVTYKIKKGDISLTLPVSFILRGTVLEASCDLSLVEKSEGLTLISIAFLPYFGAVRYKAGEGGLSAIEDYFLLPDGAGALMHTGVEDDNRSAVFSVYSKEYHEYSVPCSLGAYGIKRGDRALAVTVTEGDENSLIKVFRSNADSENINRIYPEFIITPVSGFSGNIKAAESYKGKLAVSYELLSGKNASYIGIATSVRQALIKNSFLKDSISENEYPLYVRVTGSVDGSKKEAATSFQQAENLLNILKSKGINNINMILEGFFKKGLSADSSSKIGISSVCGGEADLSALLNFSSTQSLRVFAGIDLLTSHSALDASKGISGEKTELIRENELAPYIGEEILKAYYVRPSVLSSGTRNIVSLMKKFPFTGVSILDSSETQGAVYDSSGDSFGKYFDEINSSLSAVSSVSSVMLRGSSFNIVKNADYLDCVSFSSYLPVTDAYRTVPFIPAVLHGSVIYSGEAANTTEFSRLQLLKSAEYGAAVSYLWNFSENSDKYYEHNLSEAVDFYLKAEKDFTFLASKRITDHFIYEDGVFCTEYEGGVRIFVNYNNYSVIIGDVAVMPYDYLRIG